MRKRIAAVALGALSLGVGVAFAPAAGAAPGDTGCDAAGGTPQAAAVHRNRRSHPGFFAASDGWQITHDEIDPVTGQTITVVDASGTAPQASQFAFIAGTLYTAT
jgi:hypothetical protein